MIMNLIEIDQILLPDPSSNEVPDLNLVGALDHSPVLVEQLQPLNSVVEIAAVHKVREVPQLAPAEPVNDFIQFPMRSR